MRNILLNLIFSQKVYIHLFKPILHFFIDFSLRHSRFIVFFETLVAALFIKVLNCILSHNHTSHFMLRINPFTEVLARPADHSIHRPAEDYERGNHCVRSICIVVFRGEELLVAEDPARDHKVTEEGPFEPV